MTSAEDRAGDPDRPRPSRHRAHPTDRYGSNTELYATAGLVEGVEYALRCCHRCAPDEPPGCATGTTRTAVLAPHGGGIEVGTSELCLAVAGYHPATLEPSTDGKGLHHYWMFEGLLGSGNAVLHVTSVNCDDPWAESICGAVRHAVALHGCTTRQAGAPAGAEAVVIGGRDAGLRDLLRRELAKVDITVARRVNRAIDGTSPRNICNRTASRAGAQLELTTPLREAMFGTNTWDGRKHTTRPLFWDFVSAARTALAQHADA
ncbi:poly-gamma-glutamate hydrolase family protein [Micromonospora sp. U56]|uniref:poly-gamma-glutamate hydrolase family protein n=1 Tax=Micromonospora sp. U56 TaxID=2824900 RepID=UPI001B3868E5|nr:poly-gamma-glutamate hydrolase family protein [Micromonospora sp. U56]MBQ0895444.1 poly-gamma-glutamate hydrolase family protein [Micromonospora sp. U56]